MRTLKTLKPGQAGTKALLARYGASLLRVRYRYDHASQERVKTVALHLVPGLARQDRLNLRDLAPVLVLAVWSCSL